MKVITLMTDFGIRDGNVGVMKGVIWEIAPGTSIADLSHNVTPQNVLEGAIILGRSAPYFPEGTIHVGVIDPGVGTHRRPIAARFGPQWFVGPDNGLCTVLLDWAEQNHYPIKIVHLDKPQYWLPKISKVFHGRDIFSPSAAHLAAGVPLEEMGAEIHDPIRLDLPKPKKVGSDWHGVIIHIDHFGNIATNIREEHLEDMGDVNVSLCGVKIEGLQQTFGDRDPGDLIALFGSTGNLIVSVVNGDAGTRLQAKRGDELLVTPRS